MKNQKKCSKCKQTKPLCKFYKDKTKPDGYGYICSVCKNKLTLNYERTKTGLIKKMYRAQIDRSKIKEHKKVMYSINEFTNWILNNYLFNSLYDNWVKSKYKKEFKPSIDRINDYKGYSFDNIQLVTWEENRIKGNNDQINGKNNKINKSVLQYDLHGNFIKKYYSIMQVERELGFNNGYISKACNGKLKHAYNFIWKHTTV